MSHPNPQVCRRHKLLCEVYQTIHDETESFEIENIGADLAYLVGAILYDSYCQWNETRPLLRLLRQHFAPSHAVWTFIRINTAMTVNHSLDERTVATILAALRYWQKSAPDNGVSAIACDHSQLKPLTNREIDDLCERLNCNDQPEVNG